MLAEKSSKSSDAESAWNSPSDNLRFPLTLAFLKCSSRTSGNGGSVCSTCRSASVSPSIRNEAGTGRKLFRSCRRNEVVFNCIRTCGALRSSKLSQPCRLPEKSFAVRGRTRSLKLEEKSGLPVSNVPLNAASFRPTCCPVRQNSPFRTEKPALTSIPSERPSMPEACTVTSKEPSTWQEASSESKPTGTASNIRLTETEEPSTRAT